MAWTDRVDQLLYGGETERRRLEFASATVVVTTHRVLVFTDDGEGKRKRDSGPPYRQVDRPNVGRVTVDTGGETRHLVRALPPGLLAGALLAVGGVLATVDLVPESGIGEPLDSGDGPVGVDGISDATDSAVEALGTVLTVFELGALLLSACLLAIALVCCGLYARSRSRAVVIRIRGDDDIEFPVADADIEAGLVAALKEAVQPDPKAGSSSDRGLENGTLPERNRALDERGSVGEGRDGIPSGRGDPDEST